MGHRSIAELVANLRNGDALVSSAKALADLAALHEATDNPFAIAAAGGVEALVALVAQGRDGARDHAARALGRLAAGDADAYARVAAAGGVAPLVALAGSGGDPAQRNTQGLEPFLHPTTSRLRHHWHEDDALRSTLCLRVLWA